MLDENKSLTISQRLKRAAVFRRNKTKISHAREIARKRMASKSSLKRRSEIAARELIKRRLSPRKVKYAELTTAEKISVDKRMEGKIKLIKRIAARLLPKIQRKEYQRLKSFYGGKAMPNLHSKADGDGALNEDFSGIYENIISIIEDVSGDDNNLYNELIFQLNESVDPSNIHNIFVGRGFSLVNNPEGKKLYTFKSGIVPDPSSYNKNNMSYQHDIEIVDNPNGGKSFQHNITKHVYKGNVRLKSVYVGKHESNIDDSESIDKHLDSFSDFKKTIKSKKVDGFINQAKKHLKSKFMKKAAATTIALGSGGAVPYAAASLVAGAALDSIKESQVTLHADKEPPKPDNSDRFVLTSDFQKSIRRKGGANKEPGTIKDKKERSLVGRQSNPKDVFDPYHPDKNKEFSDKTVLTVHKPPKVDGHRVGITEFFDRLPDFSQVTRAVQTGTEVYGKARQAASDELVKKVVPGKMSKPKKTKNTIPQKPADIRLKNESATLAAIAVPIIAGGIAHELGKIYKDGRKLVSKRRMERKQKESLMAPENG